MADDRGVNAGSTVPTPPSRGGGPLYGRNVMLGVTGSIAAYKACEVASRLVQLGAAVRVLMTRAATEFVSPLTFEALTHHPVGLSLFDGTEAGVEHVRLARDADVLLIAPATADVLAKLAHGFAENLLLTTALALPEGTPFLAAPAMEQRMWEHAATQQNVGLLRARRVEVIPPERGHLASWALGAGRLAAPDRLVQAVQQAVGLRYGDLTGRRLVVTAGGTREPIDPVRHIANRSSGKMGFALAGAARDRGAEVRLIAGPTALPDPYGVACERVETAEQMHGAVNRAVGATGTTDGPGASSTDRGISASGTTAAADALLMAAAVADYRPARSHAEKLKKEGMPRRLELVPTTDILQALKGAGAPATAGAGSGSGAVAGSGTGGPFFKVGFAAETSDLLLHAREKMERKELDLVVANDVSDPQSGFEVDTNRVTLLYPDGRSEALPTLSKREVADAVLDRLVVIWKPANGRR